MKLFGFLRKKNKPEKYMKGVWLAAGVHMSDKPLPPVWDEDGNYIPINVGDVLPMKETEDGKFEYYEIIAQHYRYGDWLYSTDAFTYDLKFSHIGEFKIRWE